MSTRIQDTHPPVPQAINHYPVLAALPDRHRRSEWVVICCRPEDRTYITWTVYALPPGDSRREVLPQPYLAENGHDDGLTFVDALDDAQERAGYAQL